MDFNEAQHTYAQLKNQLDNKQIDYNEFSNKTANLRFQDSEGQWWQINPSDGTWLIWNGSSWVKASPPQNSSHAAAATPDNRKKAADTNQPSQSTPQNIFQLIWMIIKGFVSNLPKTFISLLIRMGVLFLIVLIIHTYLVVVKNEGFAPSGGNPLLSITALQGTFSMALIYWTFAAFLISTIVSRIKKDGFKGFVKDLAQSPAWLSQSFKKSGSAGFYIFLSSIAVSILLSLLIKNRHSLLLYSIMIFFSFTAQRKGFLLYILKLGWSDINRFFGSKNSSSQANIGSMSVVVFGLFTGLLISYFLPLKPYSTIILPVLLITLAILLKNKKVSHTAVMSILGFTVFNIFFFKFRSVLADDGGWQEAGGTLGRWMQSDGAWKAVGMGVTPSLGSSLGGFLGGLAAFDLPPIPEDYAFDNTQSIPEYQNDMPQVQDTIPQDQQQPKVVENPQTPDVVDNTKTDGKDPEGWLKWSNDLFVNTFGTDEAKDLLDDLLKSDKLGRFKDMGQKYNFVKNLNKGLFWGGALVDTMMNVADGDDIFSATTKGVGNAFLMDYIVTKNPSIAVMELGTYLTVGGTEAADIISPSKTIKGTTSFLYDVAKDYVTGSDTAMDRVDSGSYGPNIKNLVHGTQIAVDAYNDFDQFKQDWGNAMLVDDVNGDIYTDSYKTVEDMWKLPSDVSDYSPRRMFCWIGKNTCNAVVGAGEGAARTGQALGDLSVKAEQFVDNTIDTVTDMAGNAYDGAKEMAGNAYDGAKELVGDAYDGTKNLAGGAYDGAKNLAGSAYQGTKNLASGTMKYIGSWFK